MLFDNRMVFHWQLTLGLRPTVIAYHLHCTIDQSPSIQGCSEGARGLSVLPQVPRIFTRISISLSLCWRQQGSRYAIHAGRNLPDKGFRYLWTVIVTAAVYWSFDRMLRTSRLSLISTGQASDSILHLTILQSPVFLLNSRFPQFYYTQIWLPMKRSCFSRSYACSLPSSFNTIISNTLVYSTRSPVSVFGTNKIHKLFLVNPNMPCQSI